MPYGMGWRGWHAWPYMAPWMHCWPPGPWMPYGPPFSLSREEEIAILEEQSEMLKEQLAQINKRIEELKKQEKEKK